jgi:hypothetical protein
VEIPEADTLSAAGTIDETRPEDQQQRWLKYGANVAFSTLLVLALAGIAIWASAGTVQMTEKVHGRADLSSDGSNELKPQTVQLIKDLPMEITLVSLYPKLKKDDAAARGVDTYTKVLDVLNEYRKNSPKIRVETIDPVADPSRVDAWLGELRRKYSQNIDAYEKFLTDDAPKAIEEIRKLAQAELKESEAAFKESRTALDEKISATQQLAPLVQTLQASRNLHMPDPWSTRAWQANIAIANTTLRGQGITTIQDLAEAESRHSTIGGLRDYFEQLPPILARLNQQANRQLTERIPDYPAAVKVIQQRGMGDVITNCNTLLENLAHLQNEPAARQVVRDYAAAAKSRVEAIKARADALIKTATALGPLKLDEVRKKLIPKAGTTPPAVVVLGPDDVRIIDDFALWKSGEATGMLRRSSEKPKLRFAGEQQLTSAILGLVQPTKQRVVFLHGSQPQRTMQSQPPQPTSLIDREGREPNLLTEMAERLRRYNFDVYETMPQRPLPPEVEKDHSAIYIAVCLPNSMPIATPLRAHLDAGGSALCLVQVAGEDLQQVLNDWGIQVRSDAIAMHSPVVVATDAAAADSRVEEARREPPYFVLNDFGVHQITSPLKSLDALMPLIAPVMKLPSMPKGVAVTQLAPFPTSPQSWGETNLQGELDPSTGRARPPAFDTETDIPAPIFAAAAAERAGKNNRLVVVGSVMAFSTGLVSFPDEKLARTKPPTIVSRFPANGELFTNSVFWLARNEKMMALSPSAMDTARIADMPPEKLGFLRIGIVMVVLPLMAVLAGVTMWSRRRA